MLVAEGELPQYVAFRRGHGAAAVSIQHSGNRAQRLALEMDVSKGTNQCIDLVMTVGRESSRRKLCTP